MIPTIGEAKAYFESELHKEIDLSKYRRVIKDAFLDEFLALSLAITKARYLAKTRSAPHSDWGSLEMSFELELQEHCEAAVASMRKQALERIAQTEREMKPKKLFGIFPVKS
jgi:hypothetical protein